MPRGYGAAADPWWSDITICGLAAVGRSERLEKRDQVSALFRREDESERALVMQHRVVQGRRNPVVEIRRAGGKAPERRDLEAVHVSPLSAFQGAARVRRLPHF